jgi:hypothetical protein
MVNFYFVFVVFYQTPKLKRLNKVNNKTQLCSNTIFSVFWFLLLYLSLCFIRHLKIKGFNPLIFKDLYDILLKKRYSASYFESNYTPYLRFVVAYIR